MQKMVVSHNAVDSGFLFVTKKGLGQEQNQYRRHFSLILDKAGLGHYKFHALRHTFASRCMEAGFDIKSLSDILGHTDAKMTIRIYTHSLEDHKRKNMEKLTHIYNNRLK
jgi:integrase